MKHPLHWRDVFKAATKLRHELPTDIKMEIMPLMEISFLVEDIHVKTREASQNTDLGMREFLGIGKALQSIQGEVLNNTLILTEINKHTKGDSKELEEVENDSNYSDEQRQLYKDRLEGKIRNTIIKLKRTSNTGHKDLWQKELVPYFVNRA